MAGNWWDKLSDADLRAEATRRYHAGRLSDGEMAAIEATRGNPEDPLYTGDPTRGPDVEVGPATLKPVAQIGDARVSSPAVSAMGAAGSMPPPRSDLPNAEGPGPLVMGSTEPRTPFGTQKVVGNNIPRGVGNQFAAASGMPAGGQETPRATGDLDTSKAAVFAKELDDQMAAKPADPNAAGLASIDFNQPEVRRSTTVGTSQQIESAAHRGAMGEARAAEEANVAAIQARAEHQAQAGRDEAAARTGFVDELAAKSQAHQAVVDARKSAVADAMGRVDAASKSYQDEVNNLPLGTVLNPTTAQRMGGAIAMALGAFGSTLAHGQNAALAVLDKQLDAAKEERKNRLIGKSRAINAADRHLEQLRQVFNDDDAAFLAWKADQKDLFASRLERTAALTGAQDKIDAAATQAATVRESGAMNRAAAAQAYEKKVQSSTSTTSESGPSVALKAMQAVAKSKGFLPVQAKDIEETANMDLMRREVAHHIQTGAMPEAIHRVIEAYGGDVHSLGTALADGFSKADLTPDQREAVGATFGLLNAAILKQTGKAMNQAEAPRVKLEFGLGDNASPNEIMNGVLRAGRKVNMWRAMQVTNPGAAEMWNAYDQATAQPGGAYRSSGPNFGTPVGN